MPARPRSASSWKATCAAAPATRTSSRPCSRDKLPWPARPEENAMGAIENFAKLPHIGESVRRKEDARFLMGNGQYTDDINLANQRYAVFVRSPHAHAAIRRIDTARAAAMPGVARVFTGDDIAGKMNGLPCGWLITSTDGQ